MWFAGVSVNGASTAWVEDPNAASRLTEEEKEYWFERLWKKAKAGEIHSVETLCCGPNPPQISYLPNND